MVVEMKTGNSLKRMSCILKAYRKLNLKWFKNVKYYKLVFKMLVNIFMFLILYNKDSFLTIGTKVWSFIA